MPSPVRGLGACPRKNKSILRQKLCNSEQVFVLISYITSESGGIIPSLKVGGPIPLSPPCSWSAADKAAAEVPSRVEGKVGV